jgi:hypothetical protein
LWGLGKLAASSIVFATFLVAQNIECVSELTLPQYSMVARQSSGGGTVSAAIVIGAGGRPEHIDFEGGDSDLANEVRIYLTHATTYLKGCAGKTVNLKFTFELKGDPELYPHVFVKFRPPNHFIIISRPQKPIIN